jgi:NAD(P)-dependent dehydrogenase (short-subunit alcohol dehydrogenase family)
MSTYMKPNVTPGKVILIAGCSSGLGLVMAETLARKNYHVYGTIRGVDARNSKTL